MNMRALSSAALAAFIGASPLAATPQTLPVLHIKAVLVDPDRGTIPVPRHRLLISDNPATAAPRLVVTAADGTVDVRLKPGNYTVESDRPTVLRGKSYQWTQTLDVAGDRDTTLNLTADNADIDAASGAVDTTDDAPSLESDPSLLLPKWQDSVVKLWTPTSHATGFVIDGRGLIATNQRVIGTATAVEVQLSPTIKFPATVLVADRAHDVSIVWVNPAVALSLHPLPLSCAAETSKVSDGEKVFTISTPLGREKDLTGGRVIRVDPRRMVSDLEYGGGGSGGPVFTAGGEVVGITTVVDEKDQRRSDDSPIVRVSEACEVIGAAEKKMVGATQPRGAALPVEPSLPLPADALKQLASRRAGSLNPYQASTDGFDVAFITPLMTYGTQRRSVSPLLDFANWSEYVEQFPPVLLVRVTPKQVEGFWTTVARGAAQTQGVSIPPIKHFNGSFDRMRAFCGTSEVTPIHPFKLERQISDSETVYEGLYAFDPSAFGPHCTTVKFSVFSEKEPEKDDSRVVDQRIIQQVWNDFEPYRTKSP